MRERSNVWRAKQYPFGSEMPWDSTGQEEIYSWCRYFGYTDKADVTLNAILGYMPTVPNWAYNGAARRYFDAPVNGTRWPQIGRMTNHYGSTLNAIPVISAIQDRPDDLYLMRVGYAGMDQIMSNIDENGHGSYGFDANPAILQFDPFTADFGVAFYGYARCAGAYAFKSPEFGWLGFGADVTVKTGSVTIRPNDGLRIRVWVAPAKLLIELHAGSIAKVVYSPGREEVQLTLEPASNGTDLARVRLPSNWMCTKPGTMGAQSAERGDYVVKLGQSPVTVRVIRIRHVKS